MVCVVGVVETSALGLVVPGFINRSGAALVAISKTVSAQRSAAAATAGMRDAVRGAPLRLAAAALSDGGWSGTSHDGSSATAVSASVTKVELSFRIFHALLCCLVYGSWPARA